MATQHAARILDLLDRAVGGPRSTRRAARPGPGHRHVRAEISETGSSSTRRCGQPNLSARVSSRIACRVSQFVDRNCDETPEYADLLLHNGVAQRRTVIHLRATGDDRQFLDLRHRMTVDGRGDVAGSYKYGGDILLGTSWRWVRADDSQEADHSAGGSQFRFCRTSFLTSTRAHGRPAAARCRRRSGGSVVDPSQGPGRAARHGPERPRRRARPAPRPPGPRRCRRRPGRTPPPRSSRTSRRRCRRPGPPRSS